MTPKIYTIASEFLSIELSKEELLSKVVMLSDYEELQRKVEALAVEGSAIKVMNDCLSEQLREYESDGAFDGPNMHLAWWKAETPATDAALAEVGAKAVEACAEALLSTDDISCEYEYPMMLEFAQQLRKESGQ